MVSFEQIQAAYYMVAATGVLVAAAYYVMNIRNADRERRKQTILQKLPPINREYYEWNLQIRKDFKSKADWDNRYRLDNILESKVWYITNIYNTVGMLYTEGLMSLDDVARLYSPGWIISWYDMFEFLIKMLRPVYPENMVSFERLYEDLKRRYPGAQLEQRKIHDETLRALEADLGSKISPK